MTSDPQQAPGTSLPKRRKVQVHVVCRYAESGIARFLVLQRPEARGSLWQPVTGNVEAGEELLKAAQRELFEETSLWDLRRWARVFSFEFSKGDATIEETVFVAESVPCNVVLCAEHANWRWEPYQTARDLLAYDSNKQALDRVADFLRANWSGL